MKYVIAAVAFVAVLVTVLVVRSNVGEHCTAWDTKPKYVTSTVHGERVTHLVADRTCVKTD